MDDSRPWSSPASRKAPSRCHETRAPRKFTSLYFYSYLHVSRALRYYRCNARTWLLQHGSLLRARDADWQVAAPRRARAEPSGETARRARDPFNARDTPCTLVPTSTVRESADIRGLCAHTPSQIAAVYFYNKRQRVPTILSFRILFSADLGLRKMRFLWNGRDKKNGIHA